MSTLKDPADKSPVTASVLWNRLPASLDSLPPQPVLTQYLVDQFKLKLKQFDLAAFNREPLPRYRTTAEMIEPMSRFDATEYWTKMAADRYGEHQAPDLPAYRWSFDNRPGFRDFLGKLRPFSGQLMFAVVAARFDPAGPWFDAMTARCADFAAWAQSDECSVWAGSYDICEIVDEFTYFLDLCVDRLSDKHKADLLDGIEAFSKKLRELIDIFRPDLYPRDSHVFRMTCSYAALSLVLHSHGRSEGTRGLEYWRDQMAKNFPGFGGDDGGWSQGTAYWKWKLGTIINTAEPMRDAGFVDLLKKPFIANTGYFKWYVQPPYARCGAFGDHAYQRALPLDFAIVRLLGVLLKNDELIAYADGYVPLRGNEVDTGPASMDLFAMLLLLKTWDAPAKLPGCGPTAPSRLFQDEGIVSIHSAMGDASRDVMINFRSSPSGSFSHAHADQNSFIAEAFGQPIFIASGYYPTYHHPHMKGFSIATMSHNSVLLNNQGQSIRNLNARGTIEHFESGKGYDYAIGECAAAYPSGPDLVRRHLWFDRSGEFPWLVIADHVILRQPGNVDFLLHTYEKPTWNAEEREAEFAGWRLWGDRARARVQYLQPTQWYWNQADHFPYPADGRESNQAKQWNTKATTVQCLYEHWNVVGITFGRSATADGGLPEVAPRFKTDEIEGGWLISCGSARLKLDQSADRLQFL